MKVIILPRRCAQTFGERLEEHRTVGRPKRIGIMDRRFQNTRPRLSMKPLDRHIHVVAELQQRLIKIRLDRGSQHRIAEPARRQVFQVAVAFFPDSVGRFVEHEEFEFSRDRSGKPHRGGTIHDTAQQPART
jgi:hypothetical protein